MNFDQTAGIYTLLNGIFAFMRAAEYIFSAFAYTKRDERQISHIRSGCKFGNTAHTGKRRGGAG